MEKSPAICDEQLATICQVAFEFVLFSLTIYQNFGLEFLVFIMNKINIKNFHRLPCKLLAFLKQWRLPTLKKFHPNSCLSMTD